MKQKAPFYAEERKGLTGYLTGYSHRVVARDMKKVICISNEAGAVLVARVLSTVTEKREFTDNEVTE